MQIMNVDDAGSSNTKDQSRYYVLSGVIVDENYYKEIKKIIHEFQINFFKDDYIDAEIHTHEIYKSKPPFKKLKLDEKYNILDNLYDLISTMPITIISVAIDKSNFEIYYDGWNIFNTAWTILFQRFDDWLKSSFAKKEFGKIKIDKSTKDQHTEISKIVETLQTKLTEVYKIHNVVGKPFFVSSEVSENIQIADAVGYCTLKHLYNHNKFQKYWELIEPKHFNKNGKIESYGLNIFPNQDLMAEKSSESM